MKLSNRSRAMVRNKLTEALSEYEGAHQISYDTFVDLVETAFMRAGLLVPETDNFEEYIRTVEKFGVSVDTNDI